MQEEPREPATDAPAETEPVLVLVRDLMFAARIRATAASLGVAVKMIRNPSQLMDSTAARNVAGRCIVDLQLEGAIDAVAAWKRATGGTAVGFVAHVDAATAQRARAAGIDRVLARSRFVQLLPGLLDPTAATAAAADDAGAD